MNVDKLFDEIFSPRERQQMADDRLRRNIKKISRNPKNPLCEFCKKDAYVCSDHCKRCKESLAKYGCYCGLHD